jgi:serine/threonine protein kinase
VFVQGVLSNKTIIAVKRLFMKTQQASSDFTNEVVLITNLRHQNLVNLKGFCLKGKEMLLVYEYVDNYDLDKILFGKFTHTFWLGKTWEQSWRMKITYWHCYLSSILLLRIILFISYDARLF